MLFFLIEKSISLQISIGGRTTEHFS